MAPDNAEVLTLLSDLLRATDRQTETNTRKLDELREEMRQTTSEIREEMRQTAQETNARFEAIFDRFATAVADGFIRMEKNIDGMKEEVTGVKQEITGLRQDVQQIDQRLARVEETQPTAADVIRRLEVLESIVLNKAS
jgi:archaellum component FlaC